MEITSKQQLIDLLKVQLATMKNQAIKGLLKVFANQTSNEQNGAYVQANNGVGFIASDAIFLTSLAKQYIQKGFLSPKQMKLLFKKMPKYARQLINGALENNLIIKIGRLYQFNKE